MRMAIFLVYSTSGITSEKSLSRAQNSGHFENFEILNTASIWPQIWTYRPKLCHKRYFHDDDVIDDVTGWPQSRPSIFLYIWNNNIFMITKQRAKISSLNFLCVCIIRLWLQLYEYIFKTSFMTSPSYKIGHILKLIYLRQYLSYSVAQKPKMSEMLMAIFLVYSTSGIITDKKSFVGLKMAAILKILKY